MVDEPVQRCPFLAKILRRTKNDWEVQRWTPLAGLSGLTCSTRRLSSSRRTNSRYSFHSMSGFGGATHGHAWSHFELLESHRRLDINLLHRAGALTPGAQTVWQWEGGPVGGLGLRATHGEIFLSGNLEQRIRVDWLPFLKSRYVRPRFLCPRCQRGAYHLHEKTAMFLCRACCGYEHRSRHRGRFCRAFSRIAKLRKKLAADPRPMTQLPPRPRWHASRRRYDQLAGELARAEAAAYVDVCRLLADLEQRRRKR